MSQQSRETGSRAPVELDDVPEHLENVPVETPGGAGWAVAIRADDRVVDRQS